MQSLPAPDNRVYLGRGGCGKTTLALHHADAHARVLIVNPNGEHAHNEGAIVTADPGELVALWQSVHPSRPLRVSWVFNEGNRHRAFEIACRCAWAAGNLFFLADEADRFMRGARMPDRFELLWNMGRHKRVRCAAIARRPFKLSPDITGNLSRGYLFDLPNKRDRDWVADHIDESAAEAVSLLSGHGYVEWTEQKWWVRSAA